MRDKRYLWLCLLCGVFLFFGSSLPVYATEVTETTEVGTEPKTVAATMNVSAKTKGKTAVYTEASTAAQKVTTLAKGQTVMIKGELQAEGAAWSRITATVSGKTVKGYVKTSKLERYNMFAQNTGKTNANQIIMRQSMSTKSAKVAILKQGAKVTVYSKAKQGGYTWYYISAKVNGKTKKGYVVTKYITLTKTTVKSSDGSVSKVKSSAALYKTANTKDQKYATLSKNSIILVLGKLTVSGTKWTKVKASVNGKNITGYIKSSKVGKYTYKTKDYTKLGIGKLKEKYSLRKEPNPYAAKVKSVKKGVELCIDGYVNMGDETWYRCAYLTYIGYVPASMLTITDEPSEDPFYDQIATFPESYRDAIIKLHKAHPNWEFVGVDTALAWSDVVANENVVGRNTIQSNYPKGTASLAPFSYLSTDEGAYDWSKDQYKVKDGSNWYAASKEVIMYYLDPRNFLTEEGIYQFELLSYSSNQTIKVVDSIFKNTFMSGNYSVVDKLTGQTVSGAHNQLFMTAGQQSGSSPYFLARTARLELGASGSGSVSGTYPGYEGIYNYFNIGANDSAGGGAIANGLKWASGGTTGATTYNRPWTNPEKAVIGGAQYIASSYINKGQNTSYYKKFNVINRSSGLYTHQYYTNVQGAVSEARIAKNAYDACNMTNDVMVFYIPYYDNMPASPCPLPEAKGNPNYYLSDITVKSASGDALSFNKSFNYKESSYTIAAPKGTKSVSVGASAVSKYASIKVDGTGISSGGSRTVSVTAGATTTVKVVCTAGNGEKLTYQIKIAVAK